MLLFIHLSTHQTFFLVWFPVSGDAKMRRLSFCPEEPRVRRESQNKRLHVSPNTSKQTAISCFCTNSQGSIRGRCCGWVMRWEQAQRWHFEWQDLCSWCRRLDVRRRFGCQPCLVSWCGCGFCSLVDSAFWWLSPCGHVQEARCSQGRPYCISSYRTKGWVKSAIPSPGTHHLWHLKAPLLLFLSPLTDRIKIWEVGGLEWRDGCGGKELILLKKLPGDGTKLPGWRTRIVSI